MFLIRFSLALFVVFILFLPTALVVLIEQSDRHVSLCVSGNNFWTNDRWPRCLECWFNLTLLGHIRRLRSWVKIQGHTRNKSSAIAGIVSRTNHYHGRLKTGINLKLLLSNSGVVYSWLKWCCWSGRCDLEWGLSSLSYQPRWAYCFQHVSALFHILSSPFFCSVCCIECWSLLYPSV